MAAESRIAQEVDAVDADEGARKMQFSKIAPVDFDDFETKFDEETEEGEETEEDVEEVDSLRGNSKFEKRCPPGGENRVVLYLTSLRGIRKTFDDCRRLKLLLKTFGVAIDERDVSMHSEFRQELEDLVGRPVQVPRLFIQGWYIGGAEEVSQLHEEGSLATLLPEFRLTTKMSWNPEHCNGCGGLRFLPCLECSGSCKVRNEMDQLSRCPDCNENGLIKCPVCF